MANLQLMSYLFIFYSFFLTRFHPSTIGLKPTDFTPTGVPQVSAAVLKKLAGKNLFGEGEKNVVFLAFVYVLLLL